MAKAITRKGLLLFVSVLLLASCSTQNHSKASSISGNIDGVSWFAFNIKAPKNTSLFGIKCFSLVNCIAVGASNLSNNLYSSKADYKPVAFFSNDAGTTWNESSMKLPSSAAIGILSSIDCYNTSCVAVGGTDPTGNGSPIVLISTDGGKAFNPVTVTGISTGAFNAIFCYSNSDQFAGDCLLAGQSGKNTNTSNMLEKFSISNQSFSSIALPNLTNSFVSSVECTANSSCVALGGYYNSSQNVESDLLRSYDDGSTFTQQNVSSLPPTLLSVSCTKISCVLAGADKTKVNSLGTPIGYPALFSLSTAGNSTIKTAISDTTGQGLMTSVYCSYDSIGTYPQCVATGGLGTSNSSKSVIAINRNNVWSEAQLTVSNASLYSITCNVSAKYCFAVGNVAPSSTISLPEIIKLTLK